MPHGLTALAQRIAGTLKDRATHATLASYCLEIGGFVVPDEAEGLSKFDRLEIALSPLDDEAVGRAASRVGRALRDFGLEEAGYNVVEKNFPPVSEISRRDIARCFGDDLAGEGDLIRLVRVEFPIDTMTTEFFGSTTIEDDIFRHMIRNPGDWSVEELFDRIGALTCSRFKFFAILEAALHPLARRGAGIQTIVAEINSFLRRDGYELREEGEQSGHPLYKAVERRRGVVGTAKNLIFASIGPKPELGFADAINNDIVILSNADSCLVYERPIRRDGLLWAELVAWWTAAHPSSEDPAKELGRRLRESLSSDAEHTVFDTYFRKFRTTMGDNLPALVPQVYLHYDPAIVKRLDRRAGLPRQRMDFLLLLPGNQRIVIEVDGIHHFSKDDKPSLGTYSAMVAADRELRLSGYEIYRFGANELVGDRGAAKAEGFFSRLLVLHKA